MPLPFLFARSNFISRSSSSWALRWETPGIEHGRLELGVCSYSSKGFGGSHWVRHLSGRRKLTVRVMGWTGHSRSCMYQPVQRPISGSHTTTWHGPNSRPFLSDQIFRALVIWGSTPGYQFTFLCLSWGLILISSSTLNFLLAMCLGFPAGTSPCISSTLSLFPLASVSCWVWLSQLWVLWGRRVMPWSNLQGAQLRLCGIFLPLTAIPQIPAYLYPSLDQFALSLTRNQKPRV